MSVTGIAFGKRPRGDRDQSDRRATIARHAMRRERDRRAERASIEAARLPSPVPVRRMPALATRGVYGHVPCERCGAPVGVPCSSPSGRFTRPHAERVAAAKAGRP